VRGFFNTNLRILVGSNNSGFKQHLLDTLLSSFGSFLQGEGNYLKLKKPAAWQKKRFYKAIFQRNFHPFPSRNYLNTLEMASLYHFPNKNLHSIHNISWGTSIASEPGIR